MQKIQAGSLVGELGPYMSRATKQQLRLDAAKYIIFFQLKKKKKTQCMGVLGWAEYVTSRLFARFLFFSLESCGMLGDMAWLLILSGTCQ